ncbi:MAG: Fic family protein, partial [Bacteroidota bacterium]
AKQQDSADFNPIATAIEFHYRFIRIHPFDDGNGRTVRILMNFILLTNGYPPVIIKTEEKETYFAALRQADAGLMDPFIDFIVSNLLVSLRLMLRAARGKSIEEANDLDKELRLLEQKLKERGPKVEMVRSREVLVGLYDRSIKALFEEFLKISQKFLLFYINAEVFVRGAGQPSAHSYKVRDPFVTEDFLLEDKKFPLDKDTFHNIAKSTKPLLQKDVRSIELKCHFYTFNNSVIKPFDYKTEIEVFFTETYYEILSTYPEIRIKKIYPQSPTKDEIDKFVRKIAYEHMSYIDKRTA